ncbi:Uncharacterised protein [Actinobacillus pleuropneumoniae]|nr:Uncharacterised protein [Actinobacillus pleuropneumoniae]
MLLLRGSFRLFRKRRFLGCMPSRLLRLPAFVPGLFRGFLQQLHPGPALAQHFLSRPVSDPSLKPLFFILQAIRLSFPLRIPLNQQLLELKQLLLQAENGLLFLFDVWNAALEPFLYRFGFRVLLLHELKTGGCLFQREFRLAFLPGSQNVRSFRFQSG